jgi:hypothetical protein
MFLLLKRTHESRRDAPGFRAPRVVCWEEERPVVEEYFLVSSLVSDMAIVGGNSLPMRPRHLLLLGHEEQPPPSRTRLLFEPEADDDADGKYLGSRQ